MNWAKQYLPKEQQDELLHIVNTFTQSFYSLCLGTSVRDLMPFMRQLSSCCQSPYWSEYILSTDLDDFSDEVVSLLGHLHRAMRNRLEAHSQHGDPTVPWTMYQGASKVVAAYSSLYWVSTSLFLGRPLDTSGETSSSQIEFATCIATGMDGRLTFKEVFEDFRVYHTQRRGSNQTQKERERGEDWTAPLMLFDVSGRPFFDPIQSLLVSFHEVAEFSGWYTRPHLKWLRFEVNKQIIHIFVLALHKLAVRETLAIRGQTTSEQHRTSQPRNAIKLREAELRNFLMPLAKHVLICNHHGLESTDFRIDVTLEDYETIWTQVLEDTDPREMLTTLNAAWGAYCPHPEYWTAAAGCFERFAEESPKQNSQRTAGGDLFAIPQRTTAPILAYSARIVTQSEEFLELYREHESQLGEILADIGTYAGLTAVFKVLGSGDDVSIVRASHELFFEQMKLQMDRLGQAKNYRPMLPLLMRWVCATALSTGVLRPKVLAQNIKDFLGTKRNDEKNVAFFQLWNSPTPAPDDTPPPGQWLEDFAEKLDSSASNEFMIYVALGVNINNLSKSKPFFAKPFDDTFYQSRHGCRIREFANLLKRRLNKTESDTSVTDFLMLLWSDSAHLDPSVQFYAPVPPTPPSESTAIG
ncbi:hypothetical protein E3A20_01300 [Planctomyces bekefii]|uniref:Uncharacterized protein n=1 Tax=Planctomyces bekefii TaxID=1653850 RepID=A0A5C6MDQ7_9PLAN|nr:hypothetical protein E3A20_01300 [Planctomyces bekefii]